MNPHMHPGYFPVLLWSIVIFVSFLGYGETLRRGLRRPEFDDLGWGLTAAWGMAVTLAIGGVLMAFKLAIAPILAVVVVVGAVLAFVHGIGRLLTTPLTLSNLRFSPSELVLYGLAAIAFASSIAWSHQIDPNDDLVCYLMLPVKILTTGTLIEPFSLQRAGTFGGQALLQALVMIVGAERNGHVPDRGMAMLMTFGMLLHATRGLTGQHAVARFLLLFAFWFVPVPRISTNGAMTCGSLMLAMLICLERGLSAPCRSWISFIPAGLLLAGSCSIRPTFALAAACILSALVLRDTLWNERRENSFLGAFTPYFQTGLVSIVALIPFMCVLYASNGTPMIPPFGGYVSKAFQTYSLGTPLESAAATLAFFAAPEALSLLAMLAVSAIFLANDRLVVVLYAVTLATSVILYQFSCAQFMDLYRYVFPVLAPIPLWMLTVVLRKSAAIPDLNTVREPLYPAIAAVGAAVTILMVVNASAGSNELRAQITGLPAQIREVKPFFDPSLRKAYGDLQSRVPAGDTILTMVDASYWFDFKRNTIYSINVVGGSSPPPGLPFEEGPDAVAAYLKNLGIRYVIAVDFNNAVLLYTRKLWNETTRPERVFGEVWKPRFNDFMDAIDTLAARDGGLIATAGNARLIDLGK